MRLAGWSRALEEESRRKLGEAVHELKTPLGIISGYLELLASEKSGSLNESQREILENALGACARIQRYVQDFLTYVRESSGRVPLKLENSDMNACLSEVFGYWFSHFQRKGVALYFPINHQLQPFEFDSMKIQQVVSNLLQNAWKFTPAGGSVWLTSDPYRWDRRGIRLAVSEERRKIKSNALDAVRVTVADTGPGIPPEYQQEVFNDFKISVPGQRSAGTGLGLAIARRLVEAHGGKIWVESNPGAGTKISFILPANSKGRL